MCTNWKRFTLKAIILASLSLFLYGCGSGGGEPAAPALKEFRGIVADSVTGQPFANATVTAFAVDAAGNVSTTPLSVPATVQSDGQGNFVLMIPAGYTGGIMLRATENGSTVIRAVLPSVAQDHPAAISLATEMVVEYVETNEGGVFTPANIQKAVLVLEPFFGLNFTQITPPVMGSTATPAQQNLLVMTRAINTLLNSGSTLPGLVTVNPVTGIMSLGEGTVFAALNAAIVVSATDLINAGVIQGSYTPPVIVPIPEPDLTDFTAPSAPQNLTATATPNAVNLSWGAATDNVGVTAYYVYRDGIFNNSVAAPSTSYTDTSVNSGTSYVYEVRARDAAGNVSAGSNTATVATAPILTSTISGRITFNGAGLSSVLLSVSGSGTGIFATDADGNYTVPGVRAGSYTITPVLFGFAFTPGSRTVTVAAANVTGVDFTAAAVDLGPVIVTVTNPDGSVTVTTTFPDGTVTVTTTFPNGTVTATTTYPNGTVTTSTTFPNGTVTISTTSPGGTVTTSTTNPDGSVTTSSTNPDGTVTSSTTSPNATVGATLVYPLPPL